MPLDILAEYGTTKQGFLIPDALVKPISQSKVGAYLGERGTTAPKVSYLETRNVVLRNKKYRTWKQGMSYYETRSIVLGNKLSLRKAFIINDLRSNFFLQS